MTIQSQAHHSMKCNVYVIIIVVVNPGIIYASCSLSCINVDDISGDYK